ncbi:cytochrome P450 [Tuber indicum]|nr:cytochrome P450 [Tuber indicum]
MNAANTPKLRPEYTTLSSTDSFLLSLVLLPILITIVYNRYYHPLSPFPGPFLASIWSGWRDWENYRNMEDQEPLLHERYGPIIRVSPNMISVADPDCLKEIYTRTDFLERRRSFPHNGAVDAPLGSSVLLHTELGKGIMPGYSVGTAGSWESIVDERVTERVGKLKAVYGGSGVRFGFSEWARYLSVDLVGWVVFGVDMGCTQNGRDNGDHIPGSKSGLGVAGGLARFPNIYRTLASDSFIRNILMAKADKEGLGVVREKIGLIIDAAWKSREEAEARGEEWHLNGKAMSAKNSGGTRLTKEEVHSECFLPFIAGQYSTALAIANPLKLLLANSRVLATLLSELTTHYAQKPLSHILPWTDIVDLDAKLPYLSAVLRESLRLHPPFPVGNPGMIPSSGITLTHRNRLYTIPGGYEISVSPIVIGRNKQIFGEDAHCFRPERWLEGNEKEIKRMKDVGFEWGTGSSRCIGKALAQMAVAKAIVMVLRHFEVELAVVIREERCGG